MKNYIEAFIKKFKKEHNYDTEEIDRIIKEEDNLEDEYLAAGLGNAIPMYHLGFRPSCVEKHGGAIKVYRECLKRGISWQELCHYDPDEYDPAGCNM